MPTPYFAPTYWVLTYWPPDYTGGSGIAPVLHPTLIAAVIAQLRSWGGGTLAVALGDTPSTPKIWFGTALGSPLLPFIVINLVSSEKPIYTTGNAYIGVGSFDIAVYGVNKFDVSRLADMTDDALDDAPLTFADGRLMVLRHAGRVESDPETPGVSGIVEYQCLIPYSYTVQRSL